MTAQATKVSSEPPAGDEVANDDLPPEHLVLGRVGSENFPVASRFLPAGVRADLMALYGWARLVDQLGDDYPGDRLSALRVIEGQLNAALAGRPVTGTHPLVARIAEVARRLDLPSEPLLDLVEANRRDQAISRYDTFADLVDYCRLSANPVGRTVLAIFGLSTPERVSWSDSICTGLQLTEHCQDVAEDFLVGRVYLPLEDLERFLVSVEELSPPPTGYVDRRRKDAPGGASSRVRALMAYEVARARRMLDDGIPLAASVGGRFSIAVAGFVAGGHAALDAIAAVDFDPFAYPMKRSGVRFGAHMLRQLVGTARLGRRPLGGLPGAPPPPEGAR